MNKTSFKRSFPDSLRLIEMVPVLKNLKDLTLLNLLPLLSYGAKRLTESFDQFMTRSRNHVYIGIHICM